MRTRSPAAEAPDALDALVERAERAIANARETVAESEVLAAAFELQRNEEELLVRCAWCDRYGLAGRWMTADQLPHVYGVGRRLEEERVTHSICPECMQAA